MKLLNALALPALLLLTFAVGGCASNLSSRWDTDEAAAVDGYFGKCNRSSDSANIVFDCGLYVFTASVKEVPHDAAVVAAISESLTDNPMLGKLAHKKRHADATWRGQLVEMTVANYRGDKGTIIQPSIEMFVSQQVEGKHQFFSCFHTLAMVTDQAALAKRLAGCVKGLEILSAASR